ncbi:adenine deaminase [Desulfosarcina ovata]|uniref:Adenine deaminase n=1 Tax=Desulfosarcina ovata subsp. ovata TaxID=2752305 RepID=A0A5K8AH79_9BACT|nr:adenine deaminase [Desulfosarcina ovata]BBO91220.1 adenine deaminase [Desulfosarcina ovata subsp. ovata]
MDLKTIIGAARGDLPVDLLLTGARIVNVFSGRINRGSIAIKDGYIVGIGNDYQAGETLDLEGRYVAPGFIDAHVHIESAMTSVTEFAHAVAPCGTTTVVADPHEIANVLGTAGIDYMLRSADGQPMDCLFALPSCVPATDMETAGARLTATDLEPFFDHPRVVALAEMMNYPGVIHTDPEVMAKLTLARNRHRAMDGHAPGVSGSHLAAYAAAGIASDHECTRAEEALEKLELGIHIMVREGTCARNLDALFPVIDTHTWPRMMWCTDDRHPHDILTEGHVDAIIRKAVDKGLDPVTAIRMGTINPADYFGIRDAGAIAPGRKANLVVFSNLTGIRAETVFFMGRPVAENGRLRSSIPRPATVAVPPSMHLDPVHLDFSIPAAGSRIRVIRVIADQVVTGCEIMEPTLQDGLAISDTGRDLIKLAVVDRHTGKAGMGKGFVTGLGLRRGAIASSVAHDSHNIIVAGVSDAEMKAAVSAVVEMGGGLSVVDGSRALADLPLPVAGLMSDQPLDTVRRQMEAIIAAAGTLGAELADPFMALGFLALPVIPELKLTDRGLVDVTRFEIVPLFV